MGYFETAIGAFRRGETDVVEVLSRDELDRARAVGDAEGEVEALCMLARVAVRRDDLATARSLARQAFDRAEGNRRLQRTPAHVLAATARMAGDIEAARAGYAASIALYEEFDNPRLVAMEHQNLAYVELRDGKVERARELFAASRRRLLDGGYESMYVVAALATAVLAEVDGHAAESARRLGAVDGWLHKAGVILDPDDAEEREALRDRLVGRLGPDAFTVACNVGADLDLAELISS